MGLFNTHVRYMIMLVVSTALVTGCSDDNDSDGAQPAEVDIVDNFDSGGEQTSTGNDNQADALVDTEGDSNSGTDSEDTTQATDQTNDTNASQPDASSQPAQPRASLELVADKTFRISWELSNGTEFYRVLENADGVSGFTQIGPDLDSSIQSYDHRVALFTRVNARYMVVACNAIGCTNSDEQAVSGGLEQAIGYFKASNTETDDQFGNEISLSADGNTLAISAPGEDSAATGTNGDQNDNSAGGAGAVYVFARTDAANGGNGIWEQQAYLKASNAEATDFFGSSLSLSHDGNTLAVGAYNEQSAADGVNTTQNENSAFGAGAVYTFIRDTSSEEIWQQQSYIKSNNSDEFDEFGSSVSLSGDGLTLAVGARFESSKSRMIGVNFPNNEAFKAGAVYVFDFANGSWNANGYIKPSNTDAGDEFGWAVSLSFDGNTLAVGSRREDSNATGVNGDADDNSFDGAGAAFIFTRIGLSWSQQAYLKPSNTGSGDFFGRALSLSADGQTLAVTGDDSLSRPESDVAGGVYIFTGNDGVWQQQTILTASNAEAGDSFGSSVSISADGNTLAIGANRESGSATGINGNESDNVQSVSGAAYLFKLQNGDWEQTSYIKARNAIISGNFGEAVSLSADGNTLAVGSTFDENATTGVNSTNLDDLSATASGAVFLY